ncbi:MAG: Rieske (2Fe-2S) protein [Haloarculaceae archaeon]
MGEAIAATDEVPTDSTLVFTLRDLDDDQDQEAILVRAGDTVACWLNHCQHFRHVKLDTGSGAPMRGEEILCTNHGAMFEADAGLCTFGPCEGAVLEGVDVTVADGEVRLTDPDYAFVARGPLPDDVDMSSDSNVEF